MPRSKTKEPYFPLAAISGAIALVLLPLIPLPAWATHNAQSQQTAQTANSVTPELFFKAPPLPDDQTAPVGRREGGASRGQCHHYENLTAVVPLIDNTVWGSTTAAYPTFWFYSPTPLQADTTIEFILQDREDNPVDYATFGTDAEAGIYSYTLSDEVPELSSHTPHLWTLAIDCDPESPGSFVYVQGTIERIHVDGLEPFSPDTERTMDNAIAYAKAGAWHDAFTIVAELRQSNPNDPTIETAWQTLLGQIDLETLAPEPIQDCCV